MIVDVDQAAQTLFRALKEAEDEITQSEIELNDLREQRKRLATAVRALAPELLDEPIKPKKKPTNIPPIGAAALVEVRAVVNGTVNNGTQFSSADLKAEAGDLLPKVPTVNVALRHMHANGELRLVRMGRGGQKIYEVIR